MCVCVCINLPMANMATGRANTTTNTTATITRKRSVYLSVKSLPLLNTQEDPQPLSGGPRHVRRGCISPDLHPHVRRWGGVLFCSGDVCQQKPYRYFKT